MLRALIQGNMPDCNGKAVKIWYDLSEFESGEEMAEKGCFAPFRAQAERIAQAEELWRGLGDVAVDDDGRIDAEWHGYPAGTDREEIWHDIEDEFGKDGVTVAKLMGLEPWGVGSGQADGTPSWRIAALESDIPCLPASAPAQSLDELIAIGRRWAELDKMDKAAAAAYTRFIEKDVRKALDMAESGEYIIWTDCRTRADVARENYEEGLILEYLCPEYEDIVDWDAVADCYCGTLYRLDGATFIEFGEN